MPLTAKQIKTSADAILFIYADYFYAKGENRYIDLPDESESYASFFQNSKIGPEQAEKIRNFFLENRGSIEAWYEKNNKDYDLKWKEVYVEEFKNQCCCKIDGDGDVEMSRIFNDTGLDDVLVPYVMYREAEIFEQRVRRNQMQAMQLNDSIEKGNVKFLDAEPFFKAIDESNQEIAKQFVKYFDLNILNESIEAVRIHTDKNLLKLLTPYCNNDASNEERLKILEEKGCSFEILKSVTDEIKYKVEKAQQLDWKKLSDFYLAYCLGEQASNPTLEAVNQKRFVSAFGLFQPVNNYVMQNMTGITGVKGSIFYENYKRTLEKNLNNYKTVGDASKYVRDVSLKQKTSYDSSTVSDHFEYLNVFIPQFCNGQISLGYLKENSAISFDSMYQTTRLERMMYRAQDFFKAVGDRCKAVGAWIKAAGISLKESLFLAKEDRKSSSSVSRLSESPRNSVSSILSSLEGIPYATAEPSIKIVPHSEIEKLIQPTENEVPVVNTKATNNILDPNSVAEVDGKSFSI